MRDYSFGVVFNFCGFVFVCGLSVRWVGIFSYSMLFFVVEEFVLGFWVVIVVLEVKDLNVFRVLEGS